MRGPSGQDEAPVGQQGPLARIRAERDAAAALVMPHADAQAMTAHLAEIPQSVTEAVTSITRRDDARAVKGRGHLYRKPAQAGELDAIGCATPARSRHETIGFRIDVLPGRPCPPPRAYNT